MTNQQSIAPLSGFVIRISLVLRHSGFVLSWLAAGHGRRLAGHGLAFRPGSGLGPTEAVVQSSSIQQVTKPLEPREPFVHKIRVGQTDALESLVQLGGARLYRPLEFKVREGPREFAEVGLISAL